MPFQKLITFYISKSKKEEHSGMEETAVPQSLKKKKKMNFMLHSHCIHYITNQGNICLGTYTSPSSPDQCLGTSEYNNARKAL